MGMIGGILSRAGDAANKLLPCFYEKAMQLFLPSGSYPSFATVAGWAKAAPGVLKRFFSNPSSVGAGLTDLLADVLSAVVRSLASGFTGLMDAHAQLTPSSPIP